MNNIDFLEKKIDLDFESAVKYVEKGVIEGGFNVMLVKSVDEIIETKLGERGRVLIRPSGTEPLIRIMVESEKDKVSEDYCNSLADLASKL